MSDRPIDRGRRAAVGICGVLLPLFVLVEVNYPRLDPQSQLAVFAIGFLFR